MQLCASPPGFNSGRFLAAILLVCAACGNLSSPATYQFPLPPSPTGSGLAGGAALPGRRLAASSAPSVAHKHQPQATIERDTSGRSGSPVPGAATTSLENPHSPQAGQGAPVSLDFKDADVRNVLRLLAEVSGKEIIATEDVHGRVTLKLDNVPWDKALEIIAKTINLNVEPLGNVIRITSAARAEADEEARERTGTLHTELFRLRFARATYVAGMLAGERTHLAGASETEGTIGGFSDEIGPNGAFVRPRGGTSPAKAPTRVRVACCRSVAARLPTSRATR